MKAQEKILSTALSLFFKYGIRHVTMDEIARELGMSKKTIYRYYREKDDLVSQLCDQELKKHECDFTDLHRNAKDPIHEIMLISEKTRAMMQNINPTFFLDLRKFYPEAFARFQKFRNGCIYNNITGNIHKGLDAGYYRPELDPDFVTRYRLAQIDMVMFGGYFPHEKMSLATLNEQVLDMFVYAICTPKGQKLLEKYKKSIKNKNNKK
jgi:TetR/AcrR family transcriptional regulator, cholesterol catabolism regulator